MENGDKRAERDKEIHVDKGVNKEKAEDYVTNDDESMLIENKDTNRPVYMCVAYRKGGCNREECRYLHMDGDIVPICRYYRAGMDCPHGSNCTYRHSIISRKEQPCKFQMKSHGCNKKNDCPYYHLREQEMNEIGRKMGKEERKRSEDNITQENTLPEDKEKNVKEMEMNTNLGELILIQLKKILREGDLGRQIMNQI